MKKVVAGILATAVVLSVGTTDIFAARSAGRNFCDNNADGICENTERDCRYTYGEIGNNCHYIDEDDGNICDNYEDGQCQGLGQGRHHRGSGRHCR